MHGPRRRLARTIAIAAALAALGAAAPAHAQPDADKDAVVREIIRVTGSAQMGAQMVSAMIGQLKQAFPQVPPELWDEFTKSLDTTEAMDLMLPIYGKHFSLAELRELLAFYSTPLGQKLIREMPAVMQESTAIGGEWGRRKMEEIIRRLGEKGYKPTET